MGGTLPSNVSRRYVDMLNALTLAHMESQAGANIAPVSKMLETFADAGNRKCAILKAIDLKVPCLSFGKSSCAGGKMPLLVFQI